MFGKCFVDAIELRVVLALCVVTLGLSGPVLASGTADQWCTSKNGHPPATAHLNTSLYANTGEGKFQLFELYVLPGILTLEVTVPGRRQVEPVIDLFDPSCSKALGPQSDFVTVERFAGHLVLMVRSAGTFVFMVAATDPLQTLGEYKLTTGFASFEFAKDDEESEEEEEETEDPDEIEVLPNPLIGGFDSNRLDLLIRQLCRFEAADDYSDTFTCAQPIRPGRVIAGEIDNVWGDDKDLFVFQVLGSDPSHLQTITIEIVGDIDTFGILYDRQGLRIATGDFGRMGRQPRIVKVLPPGLYFLRIEGADRAEGLYSLTVDVSSR